MLNYLEVLPEDYWKGRKCSRCKHKFKTKEDMRVGYGWYEFCLDCEDGFRKWMKRGKR